MAQSYKICPNCGTRASAHAEKCSRCTHQYRSDDVPEVKKKNLFLRFFYGVGIVALVFYGMLALLGLMMGERPERDPETGKTRMVTALSSLGRSQTRSSR